VRAETVQIIVTGVVALAAAGVMLVVALLLAREQGRRP
jgi:hypothetical protein